VIQSTILLLSLFICLSALNIWQKLSFFNDRLKIIESF
jgi:hypothetical protein